jgi:hypothetical protein
LFHRFLGVSGALLNPPDQLVFLAFLVAKVIVSQLRVLLFELSFGDIPVALDMERIHVLPFRCCMFLLFRLAHPDVSQVSTSKRRANGCSRRIDAKSRSMGMHFAAKHRTALQNVTQFSIFPPKAPGLGCFFERHGFS